MVKCGFKQFCVLRFVLYVKCCVIFGYWWFGYWWFLSAFHDSRKMVNVKTLDAYRGKDIEQY